MAKKPLPQLQYQPLEASKVASMRMVIAGRFNTGKTSLAAGTALHPDMSPVCFLDVDRRLTTLADTSNIFRVDLPTLGHAERLSRDISQARGNWPKEIREAKTFVLDSITLFRDKVLQEFATENTNARSDRDTDFLYEQRDYGYATNAVANLVDKLIQSGNHIIILAHTKEVWNKEQTMVTRIFPSLNGRLLGLLGGMMHHIWYTKKQSENDYRLLTLDKYPYEVKVTNPGYRVALANFTRNQEQNKGKTAEQLKDLTGWVYVPYTNDGLPNTLPELWNLYKSVINKENEVA